MLKIMIVEDDDGIIKGLSKQLTLWNYEVSTIKDFSKVTEEFVKNNPQLLLLDIGLPFFNGYHWCSEIRKISKVPIIFISSASDNLNMIMAMNMGADDFVVKPFDTNVLLAKIQALLRRTYDFNGESNIIQIRDAVINLDDASMIIKGQKIDLTKNEFRILVILLQNKGKVVERNYLIEKLWESNQFIDENTLNVNVNRLRKKLESVGLDDLILTKFGMGYIIEK